MEKKMSLDEFEKLSKEERKAVLNGIDVIIDMMAETGDVHMVFLQKYRELTETAGKIIRNLSVLQGTNKALFKQASNLFEQVDTLLKDFAIENNLGAEDD